MQSPETVQWKYWTKYRKHLPPVNSIKWWLKTFMEIGSVKKWKSSGQPQISKETATAIKDVLVEAHWHLFGEHLVNYTFHDILHKYFWLQAYQFQMTQQLQICDYECQYNFAVKMISCINDNQNFLNDLLFRWGSPFTLPVRSIDKTFAFGVCNDL